MKSKGSCICPDWLTCSARSWCSHSNLHKHDYGCTREAYKNSGQDTITWCETQCEDGDRCTRRKTHHCMRPRNGKAKTTKGN